MTTSARDNRGRYIRTLRGAERDAEACRLRASGWTYDQIAKQLGYGNRSNCYRAIQGVLSSTVREGADDLRALALAELDAMAQAAWTVLHREHLLVSHGRLVLGSGGPIPDDAPVLAAIDRLLKIQERRAKLLGLDAPTEHRITTLDAIDAQIATLEAEMASRDPVGDEIAALEAELAAADPEGGAGD